MFKRLVPAALLLLALAAWGLVSLPAAPSLDTGYGQARARIVLAGDDSPLATREHPARRAGPWLDRDQIPPLLAAAALAAEDRRFLGHPGVDPLALARAVAQNLAAGRVVSGGSTITMQLARLLRPRARTLGAKLGEAWTALCLEAAHDKREILCQYLNRAPFGGPLVGVGAAARHLLAKDLSRLAPAEAALLMSLPKDPARLLRPGNRARLKARRDHVLGAMAEAGAITRAELKEALDAPIQVAPPPPSAPPAPHFVRRVLAGLPPGAPMRLATYLDPDLQRHLAGLVRGQVAAGREKGLRQAAVIVLRNSDRAVLAWVGSADFSDPAGGQVDGVTALRQPGSSLKPFIYALSLQRGRTLADRIEDSPMSLSLTLGTFRPADYDGVWRGPVSLRQALGSSLNLPALRLVRELTPAGVLDTLRELSLGLPRSSQHYGLGLALGDGEVRLVDLANAYATLARGGLHRPVRLRRDEPSQPEKRVLAEPACRLVSDVLADDAARALGFGRHSLLELPFPAAVKTGTSQHYRDNWCLGYTSRYTVGVWVGNFQGEPMAGVSGITGAGPLWRQAMLLLHRQHPGTLPPWPPGMKRLVICPDSGLAQDAACPGAYQEVFAPGAVPDTVPDTAPQTAPPAPARPQAPVLTLISPAPGAVYALDPDLEPDFQVLICRAAAAGPVSTAQWTLDNRPLPPGPEPLACRLPLTPGSHELTLTARGPGGQRTARARFRVLDSRRMSAGRSRPPRDG